MSPKSGRYSASVGADGEHTMGAAASRRTPQAHRQTMAAHKGPTKPKSKSRMIPEGALTHSTEEPLLAPAHTGRPGCMAQPLRRSQLRHGMRGAASETAPQHLRRTSRGTMRQSGGRAHDCINRRKQGVLRAGHTTVSTGKRSAHHFRADFSFCFAFGFTGDPSRSGGWCTGRQG